MLRNKLVRSNGSIIDSSVIISCEFTEEVNSNTNLSVGDVTASELTVEILSTDSIQQDEVLTYSIIEDGVEIPIGVFNVDKPTVATRTSVRFSAYDNIIKTEKQFSDWLRDNQSLFPMTLLQLVQYACSHCNVVLATTDFPHADLSVNAFYADDITCRQILSWASAIAGRFVRASADGKLEFAWYADTTNIQVVPSASAATPYVYVSDDGAGNVSIQSDSLTMSDDGDGNLALMAEGLDVITNDGGVTITSEAVIPFYMGKLSYESYSTDLIERVQINHSEGDVGVIYPADATGNCFTISENMIMGVSDSTSVAQIAADLYAHLKDITYVPFNVTIPRTIRVRAGEIIVITGANGYSFTSYVMKVGVTAGGTTLSATGDKSYGSNAAVSSEKYSNLTGKILRISKTVDGLVVENKDLNGKVSGLEVTTEGLKTYVEEKIADGEESLERYKSEVEQTTTELTAKFESLDGYRNDTSAHIKTGLLGYTENNVPVYGMEIGQRTTDDEGAETFNKFARFSADKLGFYDASNQKDPVAYIGSHKMGITEAVVETNLTVNGFVFDTSNGIALMPI